MIWVTMDKILINQASRQYCVKSCLNKGKFIFKYIHLGNQFHYKKCNQKLHHFEYYSENENTSVANISILLLRSCSQH